eukprot:105650_1
MGTVRSSIGCNGHQCNCFRFDTNIKKVNIARDLNTQWIWTSDHQSILFHCLSNAPYDSPKEIISLVKTYAYCPQNAHHVCKRVMCAEKNYLNNHRLLNKRLCQKWHSSQKSLLSSFTMKFFCLDSFDSVQTNELVQAFSDHSLPSLQPRNSLSSSSSSDASDSIFSTRKTVNIDNCSVRVHLKSFDDEWSSIRSNDICLVFLDGYTTLDEMNSICKRISSAKHSLKSCMLVKVTSPSKHRINGNKHEIKLSKLQNVPLITLDPRNADSIANLFAFAVKYHWFCSVNN